MPNKTRKHYKKRGHCKTHYLDEKHIYAKKGTELKCRMKTCRANKYKSVYGSNGGSIRSNIALYN